MAAPAPTKAQLQLLEHIAANRVTRHYSVRRDSRAILRLPVADPQGRTQVTVTAAVQKLQLAGWAETAAGRVGFGGSAPVRLTKAGEEHLGLKVWTT